MATIKPKHPFDAESASTELRSAMKGLGTNEDVIITILTSHNNQQRQKIAEKYQTMYGRHLKEDLESDLSGDFRDAVLALMTPVDVFLASELRKAVKGLGTDEAVLIEILLTRNNQAIKDLIRVYEAEFGRSLIEDVEGDTSGSFKRLLVSQLTCGREENPFVDMQKAHQDASDLYEAGEGRWGTDDSVFNTIMCLRGLNQLRATFIKYKEITGKDIEDSITKEFSGDVRDGFLAIAKSIKDLPAYYAERLYKSMKGLGTDEATLHRVLVTRSELDLEDIKAKFFVAYGQPLSKFIHDDTSGDYRQLLLGIVKEEKVE